jgi:hypothetical protein
VAFFCRGWYIYNLAHVSGLPIAADILLLNKQLVLHIFATDVYFYVAGASSEHRHNAGLLN